MSPLPSVTFRAELDPIVRKELDQFDSELTAYLLLQHDDEGRHTDITARSIAVVGGPITIDGVPLEPPAPSAIAFFYRADTNFQSAQDPGAGRMRWNAINQQLATALYLDRLTLNDFDAGIFLQLSNVQDRFVIQDAELSANYQVWRLTGAVVDRTDWFELPVTFESFGGPGTFANATKVAVLVRSGTGGGAAPAAHHTTHETGGADAITSLSGDVITSGTVADARLSPNVPLKNAANTFTQPNTFGAVTAATVVANDNVYGVNYIQGGQVVSLNNLYERGRAVPVGEWQDYAVAWLTTGTPAAVNNGTLAGRYARVGRTAHVEIRLTAGSTTAFGSGQWAFSLPFPIAGIAQGGAHAAWLLNSSGQLFPATAVHGGFTVSGSFLHHMSLFTGAGPAGVVSSSVPFTWVAGCHLAMSVTYEI